MFFISLVAASTVSVSMIVTTGLDITSSTFTSGGLVFVDKEGHKWNLLRGLKGFAGHLGATGKYYLETRCRGRRG